MSVALTILAVLVALDVAYVAARAFATRQRDPSPTQAGRTLGKMSDAEYQRRKAVKNAQLAREIGWKAQR